MKRAYFVTIIILLVLLLDQALKFYIKLHFNYNEELPIMGSDWARLHFVENEGMAFGITFGWQYGKLLLSLFRLVMVAGLFLYIRLLLQAKAPLGFLMAVGLITAGAIGNILDSAFYGLIFTETPYHGGVAQLVAPGSGYGAFLHGKVVDMLYFPMTWIHMPDWSPIWGGEDVLFFSPIFNVADASITCGVLSILLFQRRFFRDSHLADNPEAEAEATTLAETSDFPAETTGLSGAEASENAAPEVKADVPVSDPGDDSPAAAASEEE